jgi:hypothetical protein
MLTHADTFPALTGTSDWSVVRTTSNFQNNGPVTDVSSSQVRCYELSPGKGAPSTQSVAAGSSVTFKVSPNLFHPGPLLFYMAKVPAGKTAKDWDGSGNVWFKIYEEKATVANGGLAWASLSKSFSICQLADMVSNASQTKQAPPSPSPARCRRANTSCAWSTLHCTQPAASTAHSCTFLAHRFPSLAEEAERRARSLRSRARTRQRTPDSGSTSTDRLGTHLLVRPCGLVRGSGVDERGEGVGNMVWECAVYSAFWSTRIALDTLVWAVALGHYKVASSTTTGYSRPVSYRLIQSSHLSHSTYPTSNTVCTPASPHPLVMPRPRNPLPLTRTASSHAVHAYAEHVPTTQPAERVTEHLHPTLVTR